MKSAVPWIGVLVTALTLGVAGSARVPNDEAAVEHALSRLTFGVRPGDVDRVRTIGLSKWIDEQLAPAKGDDSSLDARLPTIESPPADFTTPQEARRFGRQQVEALASAKLLRAVYSGRQLEELLVDFWFNHFNVFAGKGRTALYIPAYERDAIRSHVFGHFRELLEATAKSPAMLVYLDNWQSAAPEGAPTGRPAPGPGAWFPRHPGSTARPGRPRQLGLPRRLGQPSQVNQPPQQGQAPPPGQPNPQNNRPPRGLNENYGRELLELHTLGVDGGYTQADVIDVARAFTGWTVDPRNGDFRFAPARHDTGVKHVLGQTIPAGGGIEDGERVLDIIAAHPATAHHIADKLVRRFVSDEPPAPLVMRAAARFSDTHGDLREVVRLIVTSPEFFAADARRVKVKTPFEFVVSAARATGVEVTAAAPMLRALQQMGMAPYMCQPPTGYEDAADAWVSSGALVTRMNFATQLATGGLHGVSSPAATEPQQLALQLGSPDFQRR